MPLNLWQAEKLSTWLLSSGQDFDNNFLDLKHDLKVYFKPSRKNLYFCFTSSLLTSLTENSPLFITKIAIETDKFITSRLISLFSIERHASIENNVNGVFLDCCTEQPIRAQLKKVTLRLAFSHFLPQTWSNKFVCFNWHFQFFQKSLLNDQ